MQNWRIFFARSDFAPKSETSDSVSQRSILKPVFEQRPDRLEGVFQFYLLALRIIAGVERDGNFVDVILPFERLGGELRLEVEAFGAQFHPVHHFAAEDLV